MTQVPLPSRRDAVKAAALGLLGLPVLRAAEAAASPPPSAAGLKLGLATFSLSSLPAAQVVKVMQALELRGASLYHTHAPFADGTPDQCRAAVQLFRDAGIEVTSTGVINFTGDEAKDRIPFENLRAAGVPMCCGRPTDEALPVLDRLVREYDIKVAIHNHGPSDLYPTADDAMRRIRSLDPRIGVCLDVGHAWRAGGDPAAEVRACRSRLYQVHLKDTAGPRGTGTHDPGAVVVGRGKLDVKAILVALLDIGYAHWVDFEYEVKAHDKVPGLAESVGYVRGMLAALTPPR